MSLSHSPFLRVSVVWRHEKRLRRRIRTSVNKYSVILLEFVCVALQFEILPESRLVEVDESVAR